MNERGSDDWPNVLLHFIHAGRSKWNGNLIPKPDCCNNEASFNVWKMESMVSSKCKTTQVETSWVSDPAFPNACPAGINSNFDITSSQARMMRAMILMISHVYKDLLKNERINRIILGLDYFTFSLWKSKWNR